MSKVTLYYVMSDSLRTGHLGIEAKLEEKLLTKDAEG